jgi:hypothetical protein
MHRQMATVHELAQDALKPPPPPPAAAAAAAAAATPLPPSPRTAAVERYEQIVVQLRAKVVTLEKRCFEYAEHVKLLEKTVDILRRENWKRTHVSAIAAAAAAATTTAP